jgi:hypothetical protein
LLLETSVVNRYVDVVAAHKGGVDRHGLDRRHAERTPGFDVEAGTMAWALNLGSNQFAFGQGAAVVRAYVVDGMKGAVEVEYGDGPAVNLDQFLAPRGQLAARRDFYKS